MMRKCMHLRLVHLWSARAKHAEIMRMPSSTLPRRAACFSDGPHTRLSLLAYTMAKVSSVGTRENSQPALNEECALMHPLQGASFLSTPLQGGILKPPALRVVADFLSQSHACLMLLGFPTRLDLSAIGEQRFFEMPPDILDRMEMVGLKSGLRIDCFDGFSEALRVIRESGGHLEAAVF